MRPANLEHARFLHDWSEFIHRWVHKVVVEHGGSRADAEDVRQAAYAEAWNGFLEWKELPGGERTEERARAIIARKVKDATEAQWATLRGVPRDGRQRGAGHRAQVLRASLQQLGQSAHSYARQRLEAQSNALVAYQLLMLGLLHGSSGLVRPDTRMIRQEVKERLSFAIEKLEPELRALIVGFYFHERSFKELGQELGIASSSRLWRMHLKALRLLEEEMLEFASALSARHTGHTLDDEPAGDDLAS